MRKYKKGAGEGHRSDKKDEGKGWEDEAEEEKKKHVLGKKIIDYYCKHLK